ncbi:hypothetical protein [Lentzea sp. NPDC003310]|uniref:hypothetical protein n=1 Tax=Lentzea sp. NPDC003310 TaxID=3154447 RepID=UPI0033A48628
MTTDVSRYVLPVGDPVLFDDDNFLLPPTHSRWLAKPPAPVSDAVKDHRRLVLLAAGGAGKSDTCRMLADAENATFVEAGCLDRADFRALIPSVTGTVYLTDLDRAAVPDAELLPWLATTLTTGTAASVSWRLTCRTTAWSPALGRAGFTPLTLLPLDRASAESLVAQHGYDGPGFVRALVEAGRGGLSACADQLLAEARYWHDKGALPAHSHDALSYVIQALLQETDEERPLPRTPADRLFRLAKRLGAFTVFSGAQQVAAAPASGKDALRADLLPSDPEPPEQTRTVEPADYREVMSTSLFSGAAEGTLSFLQQRHAEYLAASYLVDRNVSAGQVPALLGVHESGVLPPARVELATWLCALAPGLVEPLLATNAVWFADTSAVVELPPGLPRSLVCAGLLESARRNAQEPRWDLNLTGLSHPGLEELILRHLSDIRTGDELWWAARLALAAKCTAAARLLAVAALDNKWPVYARRAAAVAVAGVGDEVDQLHLLALLHADATDDYGNELLATAIDILYPEQISTRRLTEVLRPHRDLLIGRYLLHTLPGLADRIPLGDLPEFLTWFALQQNDFHDYGDLFDGLLRRAWPHFEIPAVRQATAQLVAAGFLSGRLLTSTDQPDDLRRAFTVDIAATSGHGWLVIINLGLLTTADLEWLRETLPTADEDVRLSLTNCLRRLESGPSELPLVEFELDQPEPAPPHSVDMIRATLEQLDTTPLVWPDMLASLDQDVQVLFTHDLFARPGWVQLNDEQRRALLQAGVRYLFEHDPSVSSWSTSTTLVLAQVAPDWAGIHLLATLQHHALKEFVALPDEVWRRWVHCLVAIPLSGDHRDLRLRRSLLRAGLDRVPHDLREAALLHLDDLQNAGRQLQPHITYKHLAADLANEISARLLAGRYTGELAGGLLDALASGAGDAAATVCRQLVEAGSALAPRAREHLVSVDPNYVIDHLGADTILSVTDDLNVARLDAYHLATAARLLLDALPFEADEPLPLDGSVTPAFDGYATRGQVLQRLADNGQVEVLSSLAAGRPELTRMIIGHYLRQATTRQAELDLRPITPSSLFQVLRRGDARLVRNDRDLVDVTVRLYDDLQHYLHHKNGWREIWFQDRPQGEDNISDWVCRRFDEHLNDGRVVFDRENQVARPKDGGIGTRVDVTPTSCTVGGELARICIEAKRWDNAELDTAMHEQLIATYLGPLQNKHGIYVVYWVAPQHRPKGSSKTRYADPTALLSELRQQAGQAEELGFHIVPYVLDLRPV